jgi:hypothetical protein
MEASPKSICNKQKGDDINSKDKNELRVFFQNINGLRPQSLDKWKASIERLSHLQCDLIGMCETGVNWNKLSLKKSYEKCLRRYNRNSSLHTSCTKLEFTNDYLPG